MKNHNTHLIGALLLAATLLTASGAAATGSVFGGVAIPSDGLDIGGTDLVWTLGGYYTAPLSPKFNLGGLVAYNHFVPALGNLPVIGELFDYDFDPWEIHALGQYDFKKDPSRAFRGFVGLGVGNYGWPSGDGTSSRHTRFAWQVGLAGKVDMIEFRLGYHWLDVGVNSATWFGLTVGLVF